jgi:hypothetical protein
MSSQGNVLNNRIQRPVHFPRLVPRNLDPEFVFDLVEKFSQVKVGIRPAKVVIWSHPIPAITANPTACLRRTQNRRPPSAAGKP